MDRIYLFSNADSLLLQYFSSFLYVVFLCSNLKAVIAVGVWVSVSSGLLDTAADEFV